MITRKLSTEPIKELTRCEVFVFGSNLEGKHRGGSAGYACRHFGATYGQGVGPQGQCYAIPTMFETVGEMIPYVQEFIEYVKDHPMNRFLITRLGCGIAGFKDHQVAPLFYELRDVNNAVFALEWWLIFFDIDMRLGRQEEESPELNYGIDEEELVRLSRMYRQVLALVSSFTVHGSSTYVRRTRNTKISMQITSSTTNFMTSVQTKAMCEGCISQECVPHLKTNEETTFTRET